MEEKDNPKLYRIRHSLAHVMAQAVKAKYPNAKLGFGPPTDTGFFYDFDFGTQTIGPDDLKDIEKQMRRIIGARQPFSRVDTDAEGALRELASFGDETYKVENVRNLQSRGVTSFSLYKNGTFLDTCEGPHVESTGELPPDAFKLDHIAGAYWLGSEKNKMLTRIYAFAFENREQLDAYLKRRRMAEEFDHKKLGKELDIFHIDELVGKGLVLWLPNGTAIRDEIEAFAKEKEFQAGYKRVATPHITKEALYFKSGHLPNYGDSMFPPIVTDEEGGSVKYYLKPMNCPHHHLIYKSRMRSYRDLPLRLAEYGTCYRYEQSGELAGLLRVRCLTMNDAHIYLREEQFEDEFTSLIRLYKEFYDTFKLREFRFRLSVRGEANREKYQGSEETWQKAEGMIRGVMDKIGLPYYVGEGEASFYGPKVDIQFKNLLGREETVSTIQVDYWAPEQFDLNYIDATGKETRCVVIHRAPLSTHERFLSFLLEYYGGAFPTWCAPVQVAIIPVNEACHEYAAALATELREKEGRRVEIDDSDNSFNKKIRNSAVRKIPIALIVGHKEVQEQQVTVRRYGTTNQEVLGRAEFIEQLRDEIKNRRMLREPMSAIA